MLERNQTQQEWLELLIEGLGGSAGTVHMQRGADLYLTAAHNIPLPVIAAVAHVPHGKGMAGIAQTTKAPVQTCNLQTDSTGNIKPGAKAVDAQAAVAVPVLDAAGEVRAVVGIAWHGERAIDSDEEHTIMKLAAALPE
jgi:L-methionine (R)-S-oxide reductase